MYDYKPTALRLWFMAVLVAALIALTALTERSLRSIPDYGVDYDVQKLALSLSERQIPSLLPRVRNATAETTSPILSVPKSVEQAPAGTTSQVQTGLHTFIAMSVTTSQAIVMSRTTTEGRPVRDQRGMVRVDTNNQRANAAKPNPTATRPDLPER